MRIIIVKIKFLVGKYCQFNDKYYNKNKNFKEKNGNYYYYGW